MSNDEITNETIEAAEMDVQNTDNYGPENDMISRCLQKFPYNTDPDIVAMKIGLIDITNSTHLSQHKSKISMPNITPHVCRHTYCSNQAKAGMNPKTLQYLMDTRI